MTLYVKEGSRYREATFGEQIAATVERMREAKLNEEADQLITGLLNRIHYTVPKEVTDSRDTISSL